MTVLDAVLAAGGTNEFAAGDRTELYRKSGETTAPYAVRLDKHPQRGDLSTNSRYRRAMSSPSRTTF